MNILFVCTGNTCRSPMAEALLTRVCKISNKSINVSSRGISVFFPQPTNPKALKALELYEIYSFDHASKQLCEKDIIENDLILAMTSAQKMSLKSLFSKYKDKIYSLNEKAFGKDFDIADPFGGTQQDYNECANQISAAIEKLICVF